MLTTQDITIIVAVASLVVPPIVSLLKKESWSTSVKQLLAGLVCVATAAVALWIVAPSDFALPFAQLSALIYAGCQVVYNGYFKGSSVDTVLTGAIYGSSSTTKKAA